MKTQSGKFRIISGEYGGRILNFPAVTGLRPTPERIRETLFNWLALAVNGSRCLDLFAGSGALGFEALSRGAKSVHFVESNRTAARAIGQNIRHLNSDSARVMALASSRYLATCSDQFDIVFLDPPFSSSLLQSSIEQLAEAYLLSDHGYIYAEYSAHQPAPEHPPDWRLHRQTRAGDVRAILFKAGGQQSVGLRRS